MPTELPLRDAEPPPPLVTRRVRVREYLWFALALLVLIAGKALQLQAS